jgi:hypothetical protein
VFVDSYVENVPVDWARKLSAEAWLTPRMQLPEIPKLYYTRAVRRLY